jgi:rare lipoprotein A
MTYYYHKLSSRQLLFFTFLFVFVLSSCTANPRFRQYPTKPRAGQELKKPVIDSRQEHKNHAVFKAGQTFDGGASWYGPNFHGKKTASGAVFNMEAMTCAHRELPLGTWIQVTNKANGKKVELLVNDRGPFKSGRILDCSKAAARKLGFLDAGTAKVHIKVLTLP